MKYSSTMVYYKIKAICSEKKVPLYEVEKQIGLTVGYLSRRKGRNLLRSGISIDCIEAIANVLVVDPDEILHYTNDFIEEEYLLDDIIAQTESGKLKWKKTTDGWNEYLEAKKKYRLTDEKFLVKGDREFPISEHEQSIAKLISIIGEVE